MDGGGQRRPFMSMSSALAMPFDELSSFVRNGNGSASPSRGFQLGAAAGASSTSALETRRAATIPDAPQELVVSVSTSDRKKSTTVSQVLKRKSPGERKEFNILDPDKALKLLQGKEDFILFDKLDDALKGGKVVVIASEKGDRTFKTAQSYLLASISRWFMQKKVDGAGEEYDEAKNFDPVTKKVFTRNQIETLLEMQEAC